MNAPTLSRCGSLIFTLCVVAVLLSCSSKTEAPPETTKKSETRAQEPGVTQDTKESSPASDPNGIRSGKASPSGTEALFADWREKLDKGILGVRAEIDTKVNEFEAAGNDSSQVFADLLDLCVIAAWRHGAVNDPNTLAQAERALKLQTKLNGSGTLETYQSLYSLGVIYAEQGKYPLALPYFERAHACKINAGVSQGEIAHSIHAIANIHYLTGDIPQALEQYDKALEMLIQTYGDEHQRVAKTMGSLGNVYSNLGALEIADRLVRRSLEILQKTVPEDKGTLIAYTLVDLAELLAKQGKEIEAAEVIRQAISIMNESGPEDHPHISMEYNDLAVIYHDRLDFKQATQNYEMSISLREDIGSNPTSFGVLLNLANLKVDQGNWEKAFEEYAFIRSALKREVGEDHPLSQIANVNEAMAYMLHGDLETAVSDAIEAETRMRANARQFAGAFSSAQALNYERLRPSGLDPVLSATKLSTEDDPTS
ncbi:MAG: tetratricopeptide repeat protein, partial [Candidatus Eisenbacteria bacterium]|nr:tetratricopeptide repeat protein [Candidatus Eisenbacteria bacterium]